MATPIGSPRVPSAVGSSLVMPVARDAVEPDESAHAARCASHAVALLPCTAFATPGTMNASMPAADARALPALPAFSASAASAAHPSASFPTDFSSCPLSLRGDPETARALFGSGPDGRGPPISDPASLRPARPASYGPAPGRNNGGRIAAAYAHGAAISDALGPEASACIAADILAIAQGVADTQADLEILRTGVSDITECLENKIRDMWDLVEAEVKSECDHQRHIADVAHERRVSDHETLEAHFARLNSAINDRFIEFDDRIFRMNESRAGSITVQLQETMRTIKRYPDALQEVYLKISNAEARIGTVQQTATNRIEVIRTEMSRALYEHKERTDRLIADLTARVVQLECGRAHKTASDHSTPSRQDRAQFFDISDHDADIPRPIDLRRPIPDRSLFRTFGQHDSQIVIAGPDRSWLSARLQCCAG